MKEKDIAATFDGIYIVHQKVRGSEVPEHEHDEHEFFMPLQGEIQVQVNSKTLKAGAGKMIYLPPKTPHSFRSDKTSQGERLIVIIKPKLWRKFLGGTFSAAVMPSSQLCKEIFFQLLIHPKTRASKALLETVVVTLSETLEGIGFQETSDPLHLRGKSQDQRVQLALDIIEENFAASLTTQEIAKEAGMSLRNFNRLMLSTLGLTPKQLITGIRIKKSKELLQTGQHTVTDIAFEVGYSSVSQFISTFRKATGSLPSTYLPYQRM